MNKQQLVISIFLTLSMVSSTHARHTLSSNPDLFQKMQKGQGRSPKELFKNSMDIKNFFAPQETKSNRPIKKEKSPKQEVFKIIPPSQKPSVLDISWQKRELSESSLIRRKADEAFNIYLNFQEGKNSGFFETPVYLENHYHSIRSNLLNSGVVAEVLSNVFRYIFREDRIKNGYRPEHHLLPSEFKELSSGS